MIPEHLANATRVAHRLSYLLGGARMLANHTDLGVLDDEVSTSISGVLETLDVCSELARDLADQMESLELAERAPAN